MAANCTGQTDFPDSQEDKSDWIALPAFLDGDDPAFYKHEVEAIGYMLAYARQTGAQMLAIKVEAGIYKLLFAFRSFNAPDLRRFA